MNTGEHFGNVFPDDEQRYSYSLDIVDKLKMAAIALGTSPQWLSADGTGSYMAQPLTFLDDQPITPEDHVPFVELSAYSDFARDQQLNTWVIDAIEGIDGSDEIIARQYFVNVGSAIVKEVPTSTHIFNKDSQAEFLKNVFEADASRVEPKLSSVRDYANMYNALFDLNTKVQEQKELPVKELRKIRTDRRLMLEGPRANEAAFDTDEPKWWRIHYSGTRLYTIFASSAEDAVLDLEEYFGMKTEIIEEMWVRYSVEAHTDVEQDTLTNKYEGQKFVRLMPYSLIEYTDDLEKATDEQREAFERAELLLGKGRVLG